MVINTNIMAESSANNLAMSSANLATSLARLSSGSKIISPADDAAGLAVSMRFDAQSNRIGAAQTNVTNAISFTQTQDGFLSKVSKALDRMSTLAVLAQDGTKTDTDRSLYNAEYQQLASYISDIGNKDFNGVSLFSSTGVAVTIDSNGSTWSMTAVDLSLAAYTGATTSQSVATTSGAATALTNVKAAINQLATDRANIGASLTRLTYTNEQLAVQKTNLDAANSAIKDVDVAQESTNYAKLNILVQSGTAMLAQANVLPQSVLKLLG
jgi:flagellin